MPTLDEQLAKLPPEVRALLDAHAFDVARLRALGDDLRSSTPAEERRDVRNRVKGEVLPPAPNELLDLPAPGTPEHARLAALGAEALRAGELAFCVMAGGMATRMGGVVKALVETFDGLTFLDVRLRENAVLGARAGRPVPLWLMTSDATEAPLRAALKERNAGSHVATFSQNLGLRLDPKGDVFLDDEGKPSTHATGHGDLPEALARSGLVQAFHRAGGKYVWITNVDNLGATVDEAILGLFIEQSATVMVEVCPKEEGDRGGIPVHAEGKLQVLEEFRLPRGFDAAQVRVFNTNTFLVRAQALAEAKVPWTYFEVEKKVDGRPAIQLERLLQELTAHLPSAYLRVSRTGTASRFEPVKDNAELARRHDAIRAIAMARGITGKSST
jgi:UTP--glucose-1-phosphate uridylyltransferase